MYLMHGASAFAQKTIMPAGLLGALLYAIGGPWDQLIHVQRGHTLLATPHLVIAGGLCLYIFSGVLAFFILRGGFLPQRERNSLKIMALGAVMLPIGWVFDELWHRIFGMDMTAWSPPHIVIFFGMVSVLLGLAFFEANRARQRRSSGVSWFNIRLIFFFASIFFVALFFFIDFDVPGMAQLITSTRPEFSYPVALTGVIVFLSFLAASTARRAGAATIAALLAWGYYTGIGALLGVIDFEGNGPHGILPPFPIVIPALFFDFLLFVLLWAKRSFPSFSQMIGVAILVAAFCFFSIAIWAKLYTHLPQQLPENSMRWVAWVIFVPPIGFSAALAATLLSRWALNLTTKIGSV